MIHFKQLVRNTNILVLDAFVIESIIEYEHSTPDFAKKHNKRLKGITMPDTTEIWKFVLYKSGGRLTSRQAESTIRNLCEKYLKGRYTLEVIDIRVDIEAVPPDILAVPTIIRKFPNPERRVIGSLSESNKVVTGLGLDESLL